jgi:hypothetical protein
MLTRYCGWLRNCATSREGRPVAQAVSRLLPTAAARVQTRVWSCGICGGQSGAGTGFLRVLRFPLPIFIPPISPQSPSPIRDWYSRPVVAAVPKVPRHKFKIYKPGGRGIESRCGGFFFSGPNLSSRTMALGSTHPLTEMSTQESSWGVKGGRRLRLTTLQPSVSRLS